MTEQDEQLLNDKHPGMVVYKTASTVGVNDIFSTFSEYSEFATDNPEAHRIIETNEVDVLKEASRLGELDIVEAFGVKSLEVYGEKYTIARLFDKYRY